MKIRIKAKGHNICLWLPNCVLKGRIGYSLAIHMLTNKRNKEETTDLVLEHNKPELSLSREQWKELYAKLKQIIKTHGHFNLVEVESAKGEKVLIRL